MAEQYANLTVKQVLLGIRDTRAAITRADELIERVAKLGIRRPAALRAMAEATFRLRDHLEEDLAALEKAYADAPS